MNAPTSLARPGGRSPDRPGPLRKSTPESHFCGGVGRIRLGNIRVVAGGGRKEPAESAEYRWTGRRDRIPTVGALTVSDTVRRFAGPAAGRRQRRAGALSRTGRWPLGGAFQQVEGHLGMIHAMQRNLGTPLCGRIPNTSSAHYTPLGLTIVHGVREGAAGPVRPCGA
jgi:hypothetical protein